MHAKCIRTSLLLSFPFSFVFHFVKYNKVSHLLYENFVEEKSTTDENGEKGPFIYI